MNNNMINDVLLFNLNQCACHYQNFYIDNIYSALTDSIIADGYFFIQWLFPVQGVSKWHTHTKGLDNHDVEFLQSSAEIKRNILNSTKFILNYYQFDVRDTQLYPKTALN